MFSKFTSAKNRFYRGFKPILSDVLVNRQLMLQGTIAARQVHGMTSLDRLADVEFSVFSQWGEDGIIEWLVYNDPASPKTFIEFGVETYVESSTRFLLQNRNWRGLIIDGDPDNIAFVKDDQISWRQDLTSVAQFITTDNIDELFGAAGFRGEIGILSVDIDGNDYWVWDRIGSVNPRYVIAEYNSAFGDVLPLSVPYDPAFQRTKAHHSNLYYGASIQALNQLAAKKGYTLLGTNSAGSNAFYARNDVFARVGPMIRDKSPLPSRFREARDADSRLLYSRGEERSALIAHLPVVQVETGQTAPLSSFGELYSAEWRTSLG